MEIDLARIQKAQKLIASYVKKTPLIRCHALEAQLDTPARIFLKCDHLQLMNSFKVRGAFNVLLRLSPEEKKRGVVTRSAGNFASALAYACHLLQVPATIVMPEKVPKAKLDLVAAKENAHFNCRIYRPSTRPLPRLHTGSRKRRLRL